MIKIIIFSLICLQISEAVVKPWEPQPRTGGWLKTHQKFLTETKEFKNQTKVVFIGASITENWQKEGKQIWDSYYVNKSAVNYGIGGDTTNNVLWRIINHELDGLKPRVIVLQIGHNNLHSTTPPPTAADIAKGVTEVIKQLRTKCPESHVINIGITPIKDPKDETKAKQINEILVKNNDEKHVFFLDLTPYVIDSKGHQKAGLFKDGLHFTAQGFQVWHKIMKPLFEKLYK